MNNIYSSSSVCFGCSSEGACILNKTDASQRPRKKIVTVASLSSFVAIKRNRQRTARAIIDRWNFFKYRRLHPRKMRSSLRYITVILAATAIVAGLIREVYTFLFLSGVWLGAATFGEYLDWLVRNAVIELKEAKQ